MKSVLTVCVAAIAFAAIPCSAADKGKEDGKMSGPLGYTMKGIDGKDVDLGKYKGKVVLLVNVASKCGYTPQYKGLEELYEKYGKDGLVVIGVPANEFGKQEPGTDDDIQQFCSTNYKVTFPMLSKVVVKGPGKTPLYEYLTSKETNPKFAGEIGWNFEKFLIGRNGEVVGRFKSSVEPTSEQLVAAVKKELDAK
ncbi:glutathione peroxidase [Fimbriiglobus ruber]|uniref:Glutathione peroxidase n=1 Tax=Fimbriiglobus ruber TaxID=1908690 RepID=A0A225DVV7_9BACT|nr:glutathione peroxidase [Fimbriiglobus ruber]OWK40445.1 Glutathione peroxidase family protein [Fimbriiglobus ruber]